MVYAGRRGWLASLPRLRPDDVPWILKEERPELPELTVHDVASEEHVKQLAEEGVSVAFSSLPSEQACSLNRCGQKRESRCFPTPVPFEATRVFRW